MMTTAASMLLFLRAHQASSDAGCFMRPPPLEISNIASRTEVKSFAVDADKLGASVLLKDGSLIRILNEGCEHAGADVVLWLPTLSPLKFDAKTLIEKAKRAAGIGFRTVEAPDFAAWIDKTSFVEQRDGALAAEGEHHGVVFNAEFGPDFSTTGTVVRISYSYE